MTDAHDSREDVATLRLVDGARAVSAGQLARSFAHQAKNDLFAVVGLAEMLAEGLPEGDPTRHRLDLIASSGRSLQEQARAVSDFLRISDYANERSCLASVACRQAVAMIEQARVSRDATIVVSVDDDMIPVHCPEHAVVSAITHLLINAVQAVDEEAGTVTLSLTAEDGYALIVVSDTGTGIPAEVQDTLLEPFVSTKPAQLGLGLASAQAITLHYGGSLRRGAAASGTSFELRLPLLPA